MSDLPILDPSPLQDLLDIGAGIEVVRELIEMLREDVPSRLALVKTALDALDTQEVMAQAHQLKGSLGNLGLVRFAELARLIEEQARAASLDGVPTWVAQIPGAFEESLKALDEAFPAI